MPLRNLSFSWCRIHVFLGLSGLQCTHSIEGLLIHVCNITTSVTREQRIRSDVSLCILMFHHEVCRMINSMANPGSWDLALVSLGNLMILRVSLMMVMITHTAIVHFQLSIWLGCEFN
jgi:hypothetical protein